MRDAVESRTQAGERAARRWRPGLIDLYLVRSAAGPFLLACAVALLVMMLNRALSLAEEMAASGADLGYFPALLAWLVPAHLGLVMPAALMIALMFLVARLDETVELEAMLASGVSLLRIALPLTAFSLLVAAAGLAGTGWLEPVGRYQFRLLKAEAIHAGDVRGLQPGAFYTPTEGLTFLFERRGAGGGVEGLFVRRDLGQGRELVVTAPAGRLSRDPDGLLEMGLAGGATYEDADPRRRQGAYSLRFASYAWREGQFRERQSRPRGSDAKELNLAELAAEARSGARGFPPAAVRAELYARLARPLSVLLLPFLAIPLGFAAKKGRRGFGIAIGAVLVVAFHHLVNLAKEMSLDGSPPPAAAFILLCAGFGAAIIWLFAASRSLPSHGPIPWLLDRLGLAGQRKARAGPHLGGTIGGYVAANYALWTIAAAAGVVLILQMADLLERGDDFAARHFGLVDILRYVGLRLPLMLLQALPIAALVGAVVEMLRLGRFSEMLAIRAAGLSLPRIVAMMAPVALIVSLASLALGETIAPAGEAAFARWWRDTAPEGKAEPARWFRIGAVIVHAGDWRGGRLTDLTLYRLSGGRLAERIEAAAATPAAGFWRLERVRALAIVDGRAQRLALAGAHWRTPLTARDAAAQFAPPLLISPADARGALDGLRPAAMGRAPFLTRLQRRFSAPLAPLIMLLLAAPLALAPAHRRVPAPRLLAPLLLGLLYLVSDGILNVAAETGMVAPWLGAWLAPALFGLIAVTGLVYTEA